VGARGASESVSGKRALLIAATILAARKLKSPYLAKSYNLMVAEGMHDLL
jgi:hypothetical protein